MYQDNGAQDSRCPSRQVKIEGGFAPIRSVDNMRHYSKALEMHRPVRAVVRVRLPGTVTRR